MEAFLRGLLPRLLPHDRTFEIHAFQGKDDLLRKLAARLRGYAHWLPPDWRILVVIDRDDDDCHVLKTRLDGIAHDCGLRTDRARPDWQLVNRIAIEELEAWYFGDWAQPCRRATRASRQRSQANRRIATRTQSRAGPGKPSSASFNATAISRPACQRSRSLAPSQHTSHPGRTALRALMRFGARSRKRFASAEHARSGRMT